MKHKPLDLKFKANAVGLLWVKWREIEAEEGVFDPAHPEFHKRYLKWVEEMARADVPARVKAAFFPARGHTGMDMQIRAMKGDAVIRFVRVIKLDPKAIIPRGYR